jgi:sugar phosphate isomerase/epimerase
MKGISRRTRACAVVAATGVAVLAGAGAAQAQRPASVGDGVPTGQGSVQLFNYGGYISTGANTGAANPIPAADVKPAADGTQCLTSQPNAGQGGTPPADPPDRLLDCRWNRLDALFKFLASKGVDSVELFGHAGLPSNDTIEGDHGWKAYRALLDKHGLHAAAWHGSMNEGQWDARVKAAKIVGMDYIGSGGVADPGIATYDATLRSAEALNRMGKKAVEAGVGPVYIHNHTGEFDAKYVDNGQLKYAYDILMERTDPRYVTAELDVFWSSDAFNDVTGQASADFINKWASRMKQLHMKDGINVAGQPSPTNSRSGSPRTFGTGEVDFRPILAAAKGKVQYYHQEHDGGTITDADTSLTNLKGVGSAVVPSILGLPLDFEATAAAVQSSKALTIKNTGDAPAAITGVQLANSTSTNPNQAQFLVREGESPQDFSVVSTTCVGSLAPDATCSVQVGFKPTRTGTRSVARLIVNSNADNATESILLTGSSTNDAQGGVGGDVPSLLSLTVSQGSSFGTFVPATARTYDATAAASVTSTAGNATLTVTDPSTNSAGHLVNGAFALAQPLQVRATNAANPNSAFAPLSETAGAPTTLLTYSGPTAGADGVTVGFRQAIGANDVLRAGSYSKTLTFTLSTTTP